MKVKTIKCSQCDKTFYNGLDYRKHFLNKHLNKIIQYEK